MFDLLKSAVSLVGSVVEVVATPVVMAVDLADAATQPLVQVARELKKDVKSLKD